MQEQETNEIDLLSLFKILMNKWYWILGSMVLFFMMAYVYAYHFLENEYTANASMIVLVSSEDLNQDQSYKFGQSLAKTYTELAKSDTVIIRVMNELNITYKHNEFREMITISGVPETIIIKLSVKSHDGEEAMLIANKMIEVMQAVSLNFDGFDNIEILDTAHLPEGPSGPNRLLYLAIGLILGGIVGVGVIFLVEICDRTVKYPSEIEKRLGLRVLGTIPNYQMEEEIEILWKD